VKRILVSMILIGSMSYLTVSGTFALLVGETSNNASNISTGTLTFSNTVTSTCLSNAGTLNVNTSCDALFSSSTLMYPGALATAKVTLKDTGSLTAKNLYVYMPSCTHTTSPLAPTIAGATDPCAINGAQFYVQETDASWNATKCWYPAGPTTCALSASTLFGFKATYASSGGALSLGGGPAGLGSRYFIIGLELPTTAANTLQGQEALFDLTWGMSS
jgi:hypothetical protein